MDIQGRSTPREWLCPTHYMFMIRADWQDEDASGQEERVSVVPRSQE